MRRPLQFGQVDLRPVDLTDIMDIHQQPGRASPHYVIQRLLWPNHPYIMPLGYDGMPVHLGRSFYRPVPGSLLLKPTFITDPILHLAPLVLTGRHTEHLLTPVPQRDLAGTFRMAAIAMRIYGVEEPYAVLEPECFIRQGADRAHVDDIPYEVVLQ